MHDSSSNRLTQLRKAAGLERYDIAAKLRVDQSTVYRWERGGTIPDDRKKQLADLLGVSIAHLMGWDDDRPKQPARRRRKVAQPA
jgi:transcriptional regulator with XRE-family HTH domain